MVIRSHTLFVLMTHFKSHPSECRVPVFVWSILLFFSLFLVYCFITTHARALLIAISVVSMRRWRLFSSSSSSLSSTTSYRVKGWVQNWSFFFAFSFLSGLSSFYDGNSANPILPSARQSENKQSRVKKTECSSLWNRIDILLCHRACHVAFALIDDLFNACLLIRNDC